MQSDSVSGRLRCNSSLLVQVVHCDCLLLHHSTRDQY